ncbi:putative iron-only hydrogenase system regulator [uncultured Ruminococcus sp.]|uniref:Iron-only hydrogenase system regulator n=1 Tax=Massiliimalia timonensis TaxID=1987501 RepID=A0A8J6P1A3_9FIRM|nr:TM1266 family iron-only hydrogenase system putative regulator [Massiliimalia timonensis]MBC8610849.1 iron-only hydrogenase system regulator [Massiliimalia timonensis]MBS7174558.1 iron-only hydrogenase system regulator [Clostridiales bacterium]SCI00975.1 putative iron-only hydrogenase system regulator [uncultured Clostridium sp.]SCI17446.1 putative iron-only hydrogenase system regulator [uncultured Ruminococcus sp.]
METRIALIGIIVYDVDSVRRTNDILHEYAQYIVGRMGLPYRAKGVNIISVTLDAPEPVISALSGKLGQISGISVKSMLAKEARGIKKGMEEDV